MNIIIMISFFLSGFWFNGHQESESGKSNSGDIHVKITGIKNSKGQVGILIFVDKDGFPSDWKKAYKQVLIPAKEGEMEYTFADLPNGKYALSVMHDENNNNKLDTNMFGVPKEGYGVSNNIIGNLSAPKFADATFSIGTDNYKLEIKLKY